MTLTLRYAARSDRGLIRASNQDSVYAGPRLLAVADGMGGMAGGDIASNIVIATMAPLDEDVPGSAMIDALRAAVDSANQQLRDTVEANPAMEGMGTTLTAMLFDGSKIGMVHVGDSRAYLLRDGEFIQVTRDDTYVQMLVDEGRITAEEASSHGQRSLLTKALDGRDSEPEYSVRQTLSGDRYLLCSDGLSGVVSAETIDSTLREYTDPDQCADRLIQLALRGGGPDNITVIVADMTNEDIVEETPIVGGAASQDRGMATSADQSMPSARASAYAQTRPAVPDAIADPDGPDEDDERPHRHPVRTALLLLVLLGVFGGVLWGGWWYTQTQYYVGVNGDGLVALYRGVPGQVAGVRLYSEVAHTDRPLTDLISEAQNGVKQGTYSFGSKAEAEKQLTALTEEPTGTKENKNLKKLCAETPTAPTTSTPTAPTTSTPTAPVSSPVPTTPATSVSPSAAPSSSPTSSPECRKPH